MANRNETASVEVIIKGQAANASIKEMTASVRVLSAQLNKLPTGTAEWVKKSEELNKVKQRLASVREEVKGTSSAFQKAGSQITDSFKSALAPIAILLALVGAFKSAININREFEKSLKNLSAITGATGSDLKFFKEQALDLGENVEGGAKAVVEAIKLIAGAKPELLENKEALVQVTEAAIMLSHAAGMELPDAATRLTDAMNQFNAPASEAGKYVDALAAASKYGSAEIPQVTEALLKFGTGAKSANIDIYESAGAIELLAEKGIKGAEAGTALRNIFTKLSAADVLPRMAQEQFERLGVNTKILMDKTIPLSERLKELSKIAGDAGAIYKIFGEENKNAGEIIISNLPRLEELNRQVKESGVAAEQAATNMDTFDQSLVEASSTWDKFIISLTSGKASGAMRLVVEGWTASLDRFSQLLMGTMGQTDDIQSLMMVGDRKSVSEDQAKRLMAYGFAVDFANGKIDEQRKYVIDLIRATDMYAKSLDGVNNTEKNRLALMNAIMEERNRLDAKYQTGKLSASDYNVGLRIISAHLDKIKKLGQASTAGKEEEAKKELGIIEKLQQDIEQLTEQRLHSVDRKEIAAINKRISDKQEELNKLLGHEKKYVDELLNIRKRLQGLRVESSMVNLSEEQKERAKAYAEYESFSDEIKNNSVMKTEEKTRSLLVIEDNYFKQLKVIEAKYMQKALDEKEQFTKEYNDFTYNQYQNEVDETVKNYERLFALAQDDEQKQLQLKESLERKLKEIQEKYNPKGTSESAELVDVSGLINQYEGYINTMQGIADNFAQIRANAREAEEMEADAKLKNDLDREQRLLDMKIINQGQYNQRVSKLESDKENKDRLARKKALAAEKNQARFRILIDTAVAEVKTLAQFGFTPVGIAAMVAGGALALSQLAAMESQNVPEYAKGGMHDPNGYVSTATMFNSSSGKPFIAGEAGREWIAPNWMLENPVTANYIDMLESVRQQGRSFAVGGSTSTTTGPAPSFQQNKPTATSSNNNAAMIQAINRLNKNLEGGIGVNFDLWTKQMNSIEDAKNGSAIK